MTHHPLMRLMKNIISLTRENDLHLAYTGRGAGARSAEQEAELPVELRAQ